MKIFIVFIVLIVSNFSFAETKVFFPEDNAEIFIQGKDSDAELLYNAMNVSAVEKDAYFTKKIDLINTQGQLVFKIIYTSTKKSENYFCIIYVNRTMQAIINKRSKSILLGINDPYDARDIANMLHSGKGPYQAEVFSSQNKKLLIWKTFNRDGKVSSVTLTYN